VACRYEIPPSLRDLDARSILKSVFEAAVARVILKHPTLQAGIRDVNSKRPVWIQLDVIDFSKHIEWHLLGDSVDYENSIQGIIQSQLDIKFFDSESQPGWRVVVLLPENGNCLEVIFTWNHPHGDGISGKIFHQDLLLILNAESLDGLQQSLDDHILKLPDSSLQFPPATEKLSKLPLSASYFMRAAWKAKRPHLLKNYYSAHWAPIQTSPIKTQLRVITVDNATLANILTACRKHNSTLTSLLQALTLVSLASNLTEDKAQAFESITAIDLRRFLPSDHKEFPWLRPERTIANYVTVLPHDFGNPLLTQIRSQTKVNTSESALSTDLVNLIWSISSTVREEIKSKLDNGLKDDLVGLMKFISDWREEVTNETRKPRKYSWFVTNLGVLDGNQATKEGDAWSICRAQFSLSAEVPAAAIQISPMTVAGGLLCVACSWQDCVVEESLGERLLADLERWLHQLGTPV